MKVGHQDGRKHPAVLTQAGLHGETHQAADGVVIKGCKKVLAMEMEDGFVGSFQVRHGRLRQPTKSSSGQLLFEVVHDIEGVRTRAMWFGCNETAPSTLWFVQARMPDWTGALVFCSAGRRACGYEGCPHNSKRVGLCPKTISISCGSS